jgi:hypothetical protein
MQKFISYLKKYWVDAVWITLAAFLLFNFAMVIVG